MSEYELPLVERFKPQTIHDSILPQRIQAIMEGYVENGLQSYTAVGSAGVGKTSSAIALLKTLDYDWIIINASEEGNIETVRTKVRDYASRMSFNEKMKCIILDEADGMSLTALNSLKGILEEFQKSCKFIITANQQNKIPDPIYSRAPKIDFTFSKEERQEMAAKFLKRLEQNLSEMNVIYNREMLVKVLLRQYFPDIRKIYNTIQRNIKGGELNLNQVMVTDENLSLLLKVLREKNFTDMRAWVAQNIDMDFYMWRRELYVKASKIVESDSIPTLILILNDFDRHEPHVKDVELHAVAMCLQIMTECRFKG